MTSHYVLSKHTIVFILFTIQAVVFTSFPQQRQGFGCGKAVCVGILCYLFKVRAMQNTSSECSKIVSLNLINVGLFWLLVFICRLIITQIINWFTNFDVVNGRSWHVQQVLFFTQTLMYAK